MIAAQFRTPAERDLLLAQRETAIESQHDIIEKQLTKLAAQEQQLARLLRRQYGPQKERVDPDQLTLFTAEELVELVTQLQRGAADTVSPDDGTPAADDASAGVSPTKPTRKGHGRRPIPPHIPRETIVHELSGDERLCPCCGRLRTEIGREVSEQLEFVPAELKVLRHERVRMLSAGQCQNCKFWTYVGDEANPYAMYEFSLTREGKTPSRFLEDFAGDLQADAFSGYDQVYSKGRVIEVACLAHCRRYWWEARETDSRRAHEALGYIARLYELETQFEKAPLKGEALAAARQQHAVPLLTMFEAWLRSSFKTAEVTRSASEGVWKTSVEFALARASGWF